jgi:hypothetical protein
LGNAYYHSVQSIFSPFLLSKNIKIKIYKTLMLFVLYDQIKEYGIGELCSMHKGDEKLIQNCSWKSRGKRPLGRHRHRWKDVKMNLKEIRV